jgi:hypothetical protein
MKKGLAKRAGETNLRGVIYRGPSLIDGSPIVVLVTYSKRNKKTGEMLQTYILRDDMDPLTASKTGADEAICGTCQHRGIPTSDPVAKQAKGRTCYVVLGQGVLSIWKAYLRGLYVQQSAADMGRGRMVRVGTYGDPGAVPPEVWDALLSEAAGWTAYTHRAGFRPDMAMQSADTYAQALAFWEAGARTFRVVQDVAEIDLAREVMCPASKEAGKRTTCEACKLCAGLATRSPKSVAIVQH